MMALQSFPRCAAYLNGMNVRLDDPSMTNYWGAVILADKWTDDQLEKAGGVDFSDKTGESILGRFEALLTGRRVSEEAVRSNIDGKRRVHLMAFLGSRGVKTSALKSEDDVWQVALTLWPSIKREGGLTEIADQIAGLSKKHRQGANQRRNNLPDEFKGNHPAFSKPTEKANQ